MLEMRWPQPPLDVLPLSSTQSVSLYSWCCFATAKWWMANASSSHWLFTEVLHTVTFMPHHVTSEHFIFIHVSTFQPAVCRKCVCVCAWAYVYNCYFLPCTLPRLDTAPCQLFNPRANAEVKESLSAEDCSSLLLALTVCVEFTSVLDTAAALLQSDA